MKRRPSSRRSLMTTGVDEPSSRGDATLPARGESWLAMRSAQMRAEKITKRVFAKNRIAARASRIERCESLASDREVSRRQLGFGRIFPVESPCHPRRARKMLARKCWIGWRCPTCREKASPRARAKSIRRRGGVL